MVVQITTEYVGGMTSGTYYMCDSAFMASEQVCRKSTVISTLFLHRN